MKVTLLLFTLLVFKFIDLIECQDLVPFVKDIGGTFCKYLAYRYQIPKRFFNDCPETTCNFDNWNYEDEMEQKNPVSIISSNKSSNGKVLPLYQNNILVIVNATNTSNKSANNSPNTNKTKVTETSSVNKPDQQKPVRYVVSYAHNGFGNQLWEHSIAFMIAESLKAKFFIAIIPDSLSPGGFLPPNTWAGKEILVVILY